MSAVLILVRGSGDVGSAVSHRLFTAGYDVVIHDVELPAAPRRGMAFTDAIFDGVCSLDGITARRVDDEEELHAVLDARGAIAITTADFETVLEMVRPTVVVDARMRKRARPEEQRGLAPLTIGLGPNFIAGETTHVAIETSWGERLGAVLDSGPTSPLAGEPRNFGGHSQDRFIYAPESGVFRTNAAIGQAVMGGEVVASIGSHELAAPLAGILRGLVRNGVPVQAGMKVLEVDPRGDLSAVVGIGERPGRIAEGVLQAVSARFMPR